MPSKTPNADIRYNHCLRNSCELRNALHKLKKRGLPLRKVRPKNWDGLMALEFIETFGDYGAVNAQGNKPAVGASYRGVHQAEGDKLVNPA